MGNGGRRGRDVGLTPLSRKMSTLMLSPSALFPHLILDDSLDSRINSCIDPSRVGTDLLLLCSANSALLDNGCEDNQKRGDDRIEDIAYWRS
jgi:hypothetical protein